MRTILILLASLNCCFPHLCPLDCYPLGLLWLCYRILNIENPLVKLNNFKNANGSGVFVHVKLYKRREKLQDISVNIRIQTLSKEHNTFILPMSYISETDTLPVYLHYTYLLMFINILLQHPVTINTFLSCFKYSCHFLLNMLSKKISTLTSSIYLSLGEERVRPNFSKQILWQETNSSTELEERLLKFYCINLCK